MKDLIKETIRKQVSESLTPKQYKDESLNESLLALGAVAVGLGASWAWLRNRIKKLVKDIVFAEFIKEHDTQKVIEKKLPNILRKFKLASTLADLHSLEKESEDAIKELNRLVLQVDRFIDTNANADKTFMDKVLAIDPNKEKIRLKKELKDFIEMTNKSFEYDLENKKNGLLD
jgi:DNA-binding Lrp family transcriptional regulator